MKRVHLQFLKYFHILFYLAFVFLWFKNNFPSLRNIQISYLWALVPLILITLIRSLFALEGKKLTVRPIFHKQARVLLLIILLAVLFRVPFLYHYQGFNDGDDGLIMMQAKHLSEGELPSVYNYGVAYESSTLMHVYALLFKIFGYSILTPRLIALTIFIAFIVLQYLFLREIYSAGLALFVSLFYCFPIGHTMITSLNLSGDFPSILFFGTLSVYLSYLICFRHKSNLIPFLGFFMGLMFWIHQMTVSFLVTSMIIFALKYRFQVKKYIHLFVYGIIGAFPVMMSEIFTKFSLTRFLLSGRGGGLDFGNQVKRSGEILSYLFTRHSDLVTHFFLGLLFLSLVGLLIAAIRRKKYAPFGIYIIFLAAFFLIYFLSKFSTKQILSVRYFYPLYFVLPVILFAFMLLIKSKLRYLSAAILLVILCISHNFSDYISDISLVSQAHSNLETNIVAIEETGQKYWTGDFWDSFLITTLSGERAISHYHTNPNYYPPYFFFYYNNGRNNNFLFLKEVGMYALAYREMLDDIRINQERKLERAQNLMQLLDRFGIGYKTKRVDGSLFVFNIQEDIPPTIVNFLIPEEIPGLELAEVDYSDGYLQLIYLVNKAPEIQGFRLQVGIPGYSSIVRGFSPEKKEVTIRLPFPRKNVFNLEYCLDYKSIRIPRTIRKITLTPSQDNLQGRKSKITYLSGFGPFIDMFGKKQRICEKEILFEIKASREMKTKGVLHLFSPFDFSHPMWRGEYSQKMKIEINGLSQGDKTLRYGMNKVEFDVLPNSSEYETSHVRLVFDYHLPLKGTSVWRTAALLEKIDFQ